MKKVTTLLMLIVSVGCWAQGKKTIKKQPEWYTSGYGYHKDTTNTQFTSNYKDSVSYEIDKESCKCAVFSYRNIAGLTKYMPCD